MVAFNFAIIIAQLVLKNFGFSSRTTPRTLGGEFVHLKGFLDIICAFEFLNDPILYIVVFS